MSWAGSLHDIYGRAGSPICRTRTTQLRVRRPPLYENDPSDFGPVIAVGIVGIVSPRLEPHIFQDTLHVHLHGICRFVS